MSIGTLTVIICTVVFLFSFVIICYSRNAVRSLLGFWVAVSIVVANFLLWRSRILEKFAEQHKGLIGIITVVFIGVIIAGIYFDVLEGILKKKEEK